MEPTKTNPEAFRTLCLNTKKSLPKIAEEAGISYLTVWRIFNGKHYPKRGTFRKLEAVLGNEVYNSIQEIEIAA